MIRTTHIARTAALLAAFVGGALLAPFVLDAFKPRPAGAAVPRLSREAHAARFEAERFLVDLGREPLAWNCPDDGTARIRYFRRFCFATHVLEFDAPSPDAPGRLRLNAFEDGAFRGPDGSRVAGFRYLDARESSELVSFVSRELPRLQRLGDEWQAPAYLSAIETCVSGKAYTVVRRTGSDDAFEAASAGIVALSGVALVVNDPAACM